MNSPRSGCRPAGAERLRPDLPDCSEFSAKQMSPGGCGPPRPACRFALSCRFAENSPRIHLPRVPRPRRMKLRFAEGERFEVLHDRRCSCRRLGCLRAGRAQMAEARSGRRGRLILPDHQPAQHRHRAGGLRHDGLLHLEGRRGILAHVQPALPRRVLRVRSRESQGHVRRRSRAVPERGRWPDLEPDLPRSRPVSRASGCRTTTPAP